MDEYQYKTKKYTILLIVCCMLNLFGLFGVLWIDFFKNQPFFGIIDLFTGGNLLALILSSIGFAQTRTEESYVFIKKLMILNLVISIALLTWWIFPFIAYWLISISS